MPRYLLMIVCGVLFAAVAAVTAADPMPVITGDVSTEFGTYRVSSYPVTPAVPAYEIAPDLSNVDGSFDTLPESMKSMLASQGFAAGCTDETISGITNISGVYQHLKDEELPVFITTDACLHTFHVLYDYILRVIEGEYFFSDVIELTEALIAEMTGIRNTAEDAAVRDAAEQTIAYLSVAMALLDSTAVIDPAVAAVVAEEYALIDNLAGISSSALMSTDTFLYLEDYTQYKPRGHYTRAPELRRYFRALMWYGRITFVAEHLELDTPSARWYTRQALLLTRALATVELADSRSAAEVWERLYQPTVFFVGTSDDLTYEAYRGIAEDIYGSDFLSQPVSVLADTTLLDAFIDAVSDLPAPEINPEAGTGLRFMGQRFIPDSYILDHLVDPFSAPPRLMPKGLDVLAVLGSERAYDIIDTVYGDPATYPWYPDSVAVLNTRFAAYPAEVWAQNLYWGWLYALLPLLEEKGEGWPLFMQSQAWTDKSLATSLGSWAELRHDTILYAKQSYTEYTGEPPMPDLVRGYVEPEPAAYGRLESLAAYMREGLDDRGLLHSAFADRLSQFEHLMADLARIAVDELENRPLATADYVLMCNFGDITGDIISFPPDLSGQWEDDTDTFLAVIADVHTDMNINTCLEVGVGHPLPLYVIAPVNGIPTLTRGAMFAYYEFTQPINEGRLTDEEWQAMLDTPEEPPQPVWTGAFVEDTASSYTREEYGSLKSQVYVAVSEDEPAAFMIDSVYPNPFNPRTTIRYSLAQNGPVKVSVFTVTGQQVAVLVDEFQTAGIYETIWSPEGLGAGAYLIVLRQHGGTAVTKALYLK